jgi:two-component system, NarL family, response regulator
VKFAPRSQLQQLRADKEEMKKPRSTHILIGDDHSIVREGLQAVLSREPDMEISGEARNWDEAITRVLETRPDVAVLDLHMGGSFSAAEGIAVICKKSPGTRAIIYSAFSTDEEVYEVFSAGVRGYVLKGESGRKDLVACIRAVCRGETWIHPLAATRLAERMTAANLTPRETDVLRLMVAGKSNKEIGSSLDVTAGTVKVHVNHIFGKLGVAGRVEAIGVALRRGLVHLIGNPESGTVLPNRNGIHASSSADISKAVDPAKTTRRLPVAK